MPEPLKPQATSVRSGYDRWAAIYDHEANPLIALEEPVVREALGDVSGPRGPRPRVRHRAALRVAREGRGDGDRRRLLGRHAGGGAPQAGGGGGAFPRARPSPAAAVRRRDLRPRGERPGARAPRGSRRLLRRGAPGAAPGRPRRRLRDAPRDVPEGRPGALHRSRERREGAAGQLRPLGRRLRHGRGARGLRPRGDRRAGARRGFRRAPPAGREVRGIGRCWSSCG